ncbi:MAG: cadmium-translocating P-type ATPase [Saprospiraceae bacterium]|nr:cadmium-translocating P-type ATPase [Saprospiraceae bacterium]
MGNEHKKVKVIEEDGCCDLDAKSNVIQNDPSNLSDHNHDHDQENNGGLTIWGPVIISTVMLTIGLIVDYLIEPLPIWYSDSARLAWYLLAYLPVGLPVVRRGIKTALKGDVFTEFFLMSLATLGAFYIGEYPEGVAVMLFYNVGELFQDMAVNRSKKSIKALLDVRPDSAFVWRDNHLINVHPGNVEIGETIQIKVGERVPLDGEMLDEVSSFNTSALTGESIPTRIRRGENVLAGMINEEKVVDLKVTKLFGESALARILKLVQDATSRKAKPEQFIRRFARIYTPIVVFLAVGITVLPYFFVDLYVFNDWLYRALIFLVISCPCALVISIPLGYFGGIGAASRHGILFKGSNYLDLIIKVNRIIMDKTGTLTKGVFKVQEVKKFDHQITENWLTLVAALESRSTHPIAKAIVAYVGDSFSDVAVEEMEEISGHGLLGKINGKKIAVGNVRLMDKLNIAISDELKKMTETTIIVAIDGKLSGYLTIADEIKEDSALAIQALQGMNIQVEMLSGDKQQVVDKVAQQLGIKNANGDLLPEGKAEILEQMKNKHKAFVAFVGDGINDAPVLALSDVGIAMGGLGSDAAIETADVVIQTDHPSKIVTAIKIGKATNQIVWQNIGLAFGVKFIVLALGAIGLATMWGAVFADVGVALLAIFNAMRLQHMRFT